MDWSETRRKLLQLTAGRQARPGVDSSPGSTRSGPRATSICVASGKGEEPVRRALTPNDLWATVFRHLGVDYIRNFLDYSGRPMPMLPYGEPIAELL